MAISTLDGVIAGAQAPVFYYKLALTPTAGFGGRPISSWGMAGIPAAGTFNTTLNGGTYTSSGGLVTGQIPHYDPGSGAAYLARFTAGGANNASVVARDVLLCDRLWDNGGINISSTGSQSITSPTWPARDNTGTTNGAGVLLGIEISSTVGANAPNFTIGYTNSAGTSGRTGGNLDPTTPTMVAGNFLRCYLANNDVGVQSVQSLTLSASWTSGTINLVAYRVLANLSARQPAGSTIGMAALDCITSGFPRIWNGTVPFILAIPNAAAAFDISGTYTETQG